MKGGQKGPLPWDIAVFLTVTTVGFGYTVQKFSRTLAPAAASIASIAGEDAAARGARSADVKTLDVGCLERLELSDRVLVENVPFRLKGRLCEKPGRGGTLRVRNLSNGAEATVIFRGDGTSFVTDYLPLDAGSNRVQIEWRPAEQGESRVVLADVLNER